MSLPVAGRELLNDAPSADAERVESWQSGGSSVLEFFGLSWTGYAAILATYSVSSSTAFMPYIYGHLGWVSTPVMMGLYFWLTGYLQQKILQVAACNSEVKNMPQLAALVAGRFGYNAYQFLQVSNQQLFLPVAYLFVVKSLKQILYPIGEHGHSLGCNVYWLFFVLGAALLGTNLQRKFGHAGWLCKATCVLNTLQVLLIVTRVILNPDDHSGKYGDSPTYPFPPTELSQDKTQRGYWVDLFSSLSLFCYCYVPCFIATEAMQEMSDKAEMKKALWGSTICMYFLYALAGIVPVLAWGWNRDINLLAELHHDWVGKTANLTLLLASAMDFLITAISLNQRVQQTIDPDFNPDDWSRSGCFKWFLYSLPTLVISFLMLCFIPSLESLSGLMTAFVVPFSQILGPATIILLAAKQGVSESPFTGREKVAIVFGLIVGVVMLVAGVSSTISNLLSIKFDGDFFCDVVAG